MQKDGSDWTDSVQITGATVTEESINNTGKHGKIKDYMEKLDSRFKVGVVEVLGSAPFVGFHFVKLDKMTNRDDGSKAGFMGTSFVFIRGD
jgi:hypothetical protein